MYDCIIVGAGPAGAATAYHLAKSGRSVLVLEQATLPRYKPCTGAVSPSVARWFDCDFSAVIDRPMRRVRYTWKLGDPVEAEMETAEPIWMVQRDVFDHFLVKQAQTQGAEIQDGTAVTGLEAKPDHWLVQTAQGAIAAQYVVAADGATGPMAQWLGFADQEVRQASVLELSAPDLLGDDCAINFDFGLVKNGCLWSFPKHQGYAIGAATFRGKNPARFTSELEQYVQALGLSMDLDRVYSHPLKLWQGDQILHTHRAVRVGDAAAMADPLSAEGIRPAIMSGVKAAEAIHAALAGDPQALANYTDTLHRTWGEDMQWAQRISKMFFRIPGIGYRVGIKRPTATKRLGQLLAGELSYADIAGRVMKRLSGGLIPGIGR